MAGGGEDLRGVVAGSGAATERRLARPPLAGGEGRPLRRARRLHGALLAAAGRAVAGPAARLARRPHDRRGGRALACHCLESPHRTAPVCRSAQIRVGKPEPNRGDRGSVSDCRRTQTRSPGIFGDCYRAVRTELESLRQRCRTARVPGCPMSGQRATSTCSSSNSNSGWLDTDSIIPPTRLRATTSRTITLVAASATSPATARTQNSSSAGPGRAWITQRGSRRRSHPFGDVGGIAASRRPPASIGQNGCTRGPPSRRTEARNAIENHDASAGSSSPRSSATIRPQPSGDVGHLARRSIELRPRRHHRSLLDS